MCHEYSENKLAQDSTGNLFRDELGWDVYYPHNIKKLGVNKPLVKRLAAT